MMAGEKILVVDDEKAMRNLCCQILDKEGYEVTLAEDGKEVVNKILREDFAVAIVDIKMPEMDGMEVLRFIKKHKSHTEVIMITGYGTIETAVEAMRLGVADYITKPFNIEQLTMVVKMALENRAHRLKNQQSQKRRDKHMGNRKIATQKNEEALTQLEKELKNKTEELKKLYELSLGREKRIVELKKKIRQLEKELSQDKE
jgi:DNA-binding NtrC family response regulator